MKKYIAILLGLAIACACFAADAAPAAPAKPDQSAEVAKLNDQVSDLQAALQLVMQQRDKNSSDLANTQAQLAILSHKFDAVQKADADAAEAKAKAAATPTPATPAKKP